MAGMGPAPKPDGQRARRNATLATTKLPAEGRQGRPPRWPLIPDVATRVRHELAVGKVELLETQLADAESEGGQTGSIQRRLDSARETAAILEARLKEQRRLEAAAWRELWKLPQAVQWERLGWTRDVAQYVRFKVLGELGDMDAAKEARQWSDRLGLNPLALLRLRWEIAAPAEAAESGDGGRGPSRRGRYAGLRVVGSQTPSV